MSGILIHIGGGNLISDERLIAAVTPDSAPIKRLIAEAKQKNMLIDATCGKRTKTVYIMDSGHIVIGFAGIETVQKNSQGETEIGKGIGRETNE